MAGLPNEQAGEVSATPVGRRQRARRRAVMLRWLAAGLGAGAVSAITSRSAQAANSDPVLAGQTVDATAPTRIRNNVSVTPDSTADGLQGYATGADNSGLFGRNNFTDGIGVSGAAPSGTGVFGESVNGFGVGGQSDSKYGVYGKSNTGTGVRGESSSFVAVEGVSTSSIGVRGTSPSVNGYGVNGNSTSGVGVFGTSTTAMGVYGYCIGSGTSAVGVYGVAYSADGLVGISQTGNAVHGTSIGAGKAGRFDGNVLVNGDLTVVGDKSAGVKNRRGEFVRLYCLEGPEAHFEDIGTGQLTGGQATVPLDPEFADLVVVDRYQVFLTETADFGGLYLAGQSPTSFEVRARKAGASGSFHYRVIAKRKDSVGGRLEKIPGGDLDKVPPLPKAPEFPGQPEPQSTPRQTSGRDPERP